MSESEHQMIYIYFIKNKQNGKYYIGQSKDPLSRWRGHVELAMIKIEESRSKKYPLYKDLRQYGEDNFVVEIVCECDSQEKADLTEKFYIRLLASQRLGYNQSSGGQVKSERQKYPEEIRHARNRR